MDKFKFALVIAVVFILTGLVPGGTLARGEGRRGSPSQNFDTDFHRSGPAILSRGIRTDRWGLELDESQQEALQEIKKEFQLEMVDLQAELSRKQIELKDLLSGHSIDFSNVRNRVRKKNDILADIQLRRIEFGDDFLDILPRDQREQLPPDFLYRFSRAGSTAFGRRFGSKENYRPREEKASGETGRKEHRARSGEPNKSFHHR